MMGCALKEEGDEENGLQSVAEESTAKRKEGASSSTQRARDAVAVDIADIPLVLEKVDDP